MLEIADIFRIHGPEYRATFGGRMLPHHLRAMQDIARCRTEPLGGQVSPCETCGAYHDRYHSCQNRPCPQGQHDPAEPWLEDHTRLLLPGPPCLVTFMLPADRSARARRHQKTRYPRLFRSSSEALQELA